MKSLILFVMALFIGNQAIAQHQDTDNSNADHWEQVEILDDNSDLSALKAGERLSITHTRSGLNTVHRKNAQKAAIKKLKKLAASKGYTAVRITSNESKQTGVSKRKYRTVTLVGVGYNRS